MTRDQKMLELYINGLTLDKIGKKYGVTRERVRQVINLQILPYQWKEIKNQTRQNRIEEKEKRAQINNCKVCKNRTRNKMFCSRSCFADFRRLPIEEKKKRQAERMRRYHQRHPEKIREMNKRYYYKRKNDFIKFKRFYENAQKS